MEKQTMIELFELVKSNLINKIFSGDYETGICRGIYDLEETNVITIFERYELRRYLIENKPTTRNKYKEFTKNEYWKDGIYWWTSILSNPNARQVRIDYLTALISNIK